MASVDGFMSRAPSRMKKTWRAWLGSGACPHIVGDSVTPITRHGPGFSPQTGAGEWRGLQMVRA
jgi:hypothetical protein